MPPTTHDHYDIEYHIMHQGGKQLNLILKLKMKLDSPLFQHQQDVLWRCSVRVSYIRRDLFLTDNSLQSRSEWNEK